MTKKIFHLASFEGNLGDNASHLGLRYALESNCKHEIAWTRVEVRKHYQNYRGEDKVKFTDEYIEFINQHDLMVIGGGNFFETSINNSQTGTTIDIDRAQLQKIKTPIWFNGLGFDTYKGAEPETLNKFKAFIDVCSENRDILLTLRNDGSMKQMAHTLGPSYVEKFTEIADWGFFTNKVHQPVDDFFTNLIPRKSIALNLNLDMTSLRFPETKEYPVSYKAFIGELTRWLEHKIEEGYMLIFVPHIYSDIKVYMELMDNLNVKYSRSGMVRIAPYLVGDEAFHLALEIYKRVEFATGMRFHLSVCTMSIGCEVHPMVSYRKVFDLFEGLGFPNKPVFINKEDFVGELEKRIKGPSTIHELNTVVNKWQQHNLQFVKNEIVHRYLC